MVCICTVCDNNSPCRFVLYVASNVSIAMQGDYLGRTVCRRIEPRFHQCCAGYVGGRYIIPSPYSRVMPLFVQLITIIYSEPAFNYSEQKHVRSRSDAVDPV